MCWCQPEWVASSRKSASPKRHGVAAWHGATGNEAPPLGAELKVDIEVHAGERGTRYWARVRWHDAGSGRRKGIKRSYSSRAEAEAWIARMHRAATTGIDPGQTLASFVAYLDDRWARGIDRTSTFDPYEAGLRLRVLPTLGHLPVTMITAGLVDRAIDGWEERYGRSTVKNSVAVLVLVLDEAVRDGVIPRNPAKDRARRRTMGSTLVRRRA
jgi:hypothetical protein